MEDNETDLASRIHQIALEAKRRNPEGYKVRPPSFRHSASSVRTLRRLQTRFSSTISSDQFDKFDGLDRERSEDDSFIGSSGNSARKGAGAELVTMSDEELEFTNFTSSYSDYDYECESEDSITYVNPKSGQSFCLLATTVNVPLSLKLASDSELS